MKELPVKEKKIKIKKRYFNYLVFVSDANETNLVERKGKGIWQGLYEFPVVESEENIDVAVLVASDIFKNSCSKECEITLFNEKEIVHKLSHQHIYTKFWIVKGVASRLTLFNWEEVNELPVPVLIANFLKQFNPEHGYF